MPRGRPPHAAEDGALLWPASPCMVNINTANAIRTGVGMDWRKFLAGVRQRAVPIALVILGLAAAAAVMWFLPNRTAAVILGVFAAAVFYFTVLRARTATTQAAVLWFALGVTADAAYAKLNDVLPVTIAGALTKVVDAVVKLGDSILRSAVMLPPDSRARIGAVTPDFVWAVILGLIVLMLFDRFTRRG